LTSKQKGEIIVNSSPSLLNYIYKLATDPNERANFARNPDQAMTAAGLQDGDKNVIKNFLALENTAQQNMENAISALVTQFLPPPPGPPPVTGGVNSSGPP